MDKIILYKYNVDILISGILHKNQSGKTIKDKGDYHIKYFFFQKQLKDLWTNVDSYLPVSLTNAAVTMCGAMKVCEGTVVSS